MKAEEALNQFFKEWDVTVKRYRARLYTKDEMNAMTIFSRWLDKHYRLEPIVSIAKKKEHL